MKRKRDPGQALEFSIESLRHAIAANLRIDPARLRFGNLPGKGVGMRGTAGEHWQIHYRGKWRELPWHPEGPAGVRREHVRQWHGHATEEERRS
ncbi:hypothetical protein LOC70_19660 [Rhodopirellula sp. JC737]|nr:hypothetical protein [Rhodopirellula sp. JC737]